MTKNDVWRIGQIIIDQQLHRNALDDSSIYSLVLVTFFSYYYFSERRQYLYEFRGNFFIRSASCKRSDTLLQNVSLKICLLTFLLFLTSHKSTNTRYTVDKIFNTIDECLYRRFSFSSQRILLSHRVRNSLIVSSLSESEKNSNPWNQFTEESAGVTERSDKLPETDCRGKKEALLGPVHRSP